MIPKPIDRQRLINLKKAIEKGDVPEVEVATYVKGKYAFGDLKAMGWAHVEEIGERNECWVYTGPGMIKAEGKTLKKGDRTSPIEADYS